MPPAKLRSHLYLRAVRWLAIEDADTVGRLDALALAGLVQVRLCAYLWGRPALLVARDILASRPQIM